MTTSHEFFFTKIEIGGDTFECVVEYFCSGLDPEIVGVVAHNGNKELDLTDFLPDCQKSELAVEILDFLLERDAEVRSAFQSF